MPDYTARFTANAAASIACFALANQTHGQANVVLIAVGLVTLASSSHWLYKAIRLYFARAAFISQRHRRP